MNYWEQFAEMLGLELDEEFSLIKSDGTKVDNDLYKIREDGLFYQKRKDDAWLSEPSTTLSSLLQGSYKVVHKPFKPKKGEKYWAWGKDAHMAIMQEWHSFESDFLLWKLGNCFKTKEEAEDKGKEIMEQIYKEYEEK